MMMMINTKISMTLKSGDGDDEEENDYYYY
jgi:hypothetical protein